MAWVAGVGVTAGLRLLEVPRDARARDAQLWRGHESRRAELEEAPHVDLPSDLQ